ncbi:50S ribosomal protein L37ae [Nanoarchaeota archaeon]
MAKKKLSLSTKRFGPRYGRKIKLKYALIEAERKKKQKCPYCLKEKVNRVSVGIWLCNSCNSKFAGKAYSLDKKLTQEGAE